MINVIKLIFQIWHKRNRMPDLIIGTSTMNSMALLLYSILFKKAFKVLLINFYLHGLGDNPSVQNLLRILISNNHIYIVVQSQYDLKQYSILYPNTSLIYIPYCQDAVISKE